MEILDAVGKQHAIYSLLASNRVTVPLFSLKFSFFLPANIRKSALLRSQGMRKENVMYGSIKNATKNLKKKNTVWFSMDIKYRK